MLGTSSAALIGLLFVATSLHLGEVVSNPGFRVRSYNQTVYLLTLVVEAVLILVPQPVPFLGAELMVLNLVGLWLPISTSYTFLYKQRDNSHRGGMKMSRAITLSGAYLLGIAGGIALIQGSHWGMYIVPVSYTTLLVTVVLGAWSTMLGIEQRQLAALAFCDPDVRFGSLADISQCNRHVRFCANSRHSSIMGQPGHSPKNARRRVPCKGPAAAEAGRHPE